MYHGPLRHSPGFDEKNHGKLLIRILLPTGVKFDLAVRLLLKTRPSFGLVSYFPIRDTAEVTFVNLSKCCQSLCHECHDELAPPCRSLPCHQRQRHPYCKTASLLIVPFPTLVAQIGSWHGTTPQHVPLPTVADLDTTDLSHPSVNSFSRTFIK